MIRREWSEAEGRRLEAFVKARWTRSQGGISALAEDIDSTRETMYGWFRGDNPPSLYHLSRLAEQLGVSRSQIVAAADGEAPVLPMDDATRELIRAEVAAELGRRGLGPERRE